MNGRIIRYFSNKGYGFIMGEDGISRFFHISQVSKSDITFIGEGERVQFNPIKTSRGQNAVNVIVTSKKAHIDIPTFISFGSIRIKVKNIKNYGLTHETVAYTVNEERSHDFLGKVMNILVGPIEEHKERERAVLYVTTYQGDNFRFNEETSDFDVKEKLTELDSFLAD